MELNRNPWIIIVLLLLSCGRSLPVERLLKRLDYPYEVDREGDFRVEVPVNSGRANL